MSDAVAKARARYIAALEDILAADPIIGDYIPLRKHLREQLKSLRVKLAEVPNKEKPAVSAEMSAISNKLRQIHVRIQNTASGDVQAAVRELRSLRV